MKGVVDVVGFNRKWVMGAEDTYPLNIDYRQSKHSDRQSHCPVYSTGVEWGLWQAWGTTNLKAKERCLCECVCCGRVRVSVTGWRDKSHFSSICWAWLDLADCLKNFCIKMPCSLVWFRDPYAPQIRQCFVVTVTITIVTNLCNHAVCFSRGKTFSKI